MYQKLFNFLFEFRKQEADFSASKANLTLICGLIFLPFIMGYTAVAYLFISSEVLWRVALAQNLLHILLLYLIRSSISLNKIIHTVLALALLFQGSYAYYTGGFDAKALIWPTILPVIAGMTMSKRQVVIWAGMNLACISLFLGLQFFGVKTPNLMDINGQLYSNIILFYSWSFTLAGMIFFFLYWSDIQAEIISSRTEAAQRLIRVLCHDVANPLSVILGRLYLQKKHPLDAQNLNKMLVAAEKISEIISSVGTLQAFETGKRQLELRTVNLAHAVDRMVDLFEDKLKSKNIQILKSRVEPLEIEVDSSLFENQILGNLISNAIKFSYAGSKIEIQVYQENNKAVLTVRDWGIGIDAAKLKQLFDSKAPTSSKGTMGEEGTGFGMPIMLSFLHLMKGDLQICTSTQEADHGTTFRICFQKKVSLDTTPGAVVSKAS